MDVPTQVFVGLTGNLKDFPATGNDKTEQLPTFEAAA
jgi:hypothetical protein